MPRRVASSCPAQGAIRSAPIGWPDSLCHGCATDEAENCHLPPFVSLAVTSDTAFKHRRRRKQGKD